MYIFNPTLKSLRERLNIKSINGGKTLINSYGLVSDDIESLYPFVGINECVYFKSGTEFSSIQYRGQNEDYGVCKTTLDRLDSKEKQFLSICQTIAFEELLENHPFIKFARTIKFFDKPLNLNLTGISQHYGLHTNYLDITNNFDVACFFATCKYEEGKYYPIGNIKKAGVIYQIIEPEFNSSINNKNNIEIEYLGWQPLPRPEEQRASVLKIDKNIDINTVKGIHKYYFKHSCS